MLLFLCLAACGGKTGDKPGVGVGAVAVPVETVPECVQYQTAFDACFHRDSGFATQPAMIPTTPADRDRIGAICSENLARLKTACR